MSDKLKKDVRRNRLCIISTVVSVGITFLFLVFSVAPFISAAFGIFVYLILGIGAGLVSFASLGMVWISEDFRKKWEGAFGFANKLFNSGQMIADAIGKNVIWISIIMLILSSFGFITNMINYKKHKDNKVYLIISIIALSVSLCALIVSDIIYLTYKDNPIG